LSKYLLKLSTYSSMRFSTQPRTHSSPKRVTWWKRLTPWEFLWISLLNRLNLTKWDY